MIPFPSRCGALALVLAAGSWLDLVAFQSAAVAQTLDPSPVASAPTTQADQKLAAQMVDAGAKGRHLAPYGTFYVLAYVSVRTENGVSGFAPGQEVHVVEVNRAKQTLLVSDGHAQVEVPPSNLTNDLDIAALVRQKDEASQTQIAAHQQAEQAAYAKFEREAADFTAKDFERRQKIQQDQAAERRREEQTPVARTAEPANNATDGNGYYGSGGLGYGSPYSYFSDPAVVVAPGNNAAGPAARGAVPATGSAAAPAAGRAANPATVGSAGRPPR